MCKSLVLLSYKALYRIVSGKHPWALATQASKFEGGQLHGECLNGSTIPTQGPTSNVNLAAMELNRLASLAHLVFRRGQPDSGESSSLSS